MRSGVGNKSVFMSIQASKYQYDRYDVKRIFCIELSCNESCCNARADEYHPSRYDDQCGVRAKQPKFKKMDWYERK